MTVQSSINVYYGTPQGAIRQELLRKLLIGLWWNSIFFSTEASLECCHFRPFLCDFYTLLVTCNGVGHFKQLLSIFCIWCVWANFCYFHNIPYLCWTTSPIQKLVWRCLCVFMSSHILMSTCFYIFLLQVFMLFYACHLFCLLCSLLGCYPLLRLESCAPRMLQAYFLY